MCPTEPTRWCPPCRSPSRRGCFSALGTPIRQGRLFLDRELEPVAIVSESYARRAWPGEPAVGKSIRVGLPTGERLRVIGVVSDSRRVSVERESFGQVYQLASQSTYFSPSRILVRTTGAVDRTVAAIGRAVRETDPLQPVSNMRLLDDIVSGSLGSRRFTLLLLGGFAALALLSRIARRLWAAGAARRGAPRRDRCAHGPGRAAGGHRAHGRERRARRGGGRPRSRAARRVAWIARAGRRRLRRVRDRSRALRCSGGPALHPRLCRCRRSGRARAPPRSVPPHPFVATIRAE